MRRRLAIEEIIVDASLSVPEVVAKNLLDQEPRTLFDQICVSHNLNDSQQEAFRTSMTTRLSLVQGPPGTVKTALGKAILDCLVRLKENRSGEG